jgi:hypothetical protein
MKTLCGSLSALIASLLMAAQPADALESREYILVSQREAANVGGGACSVRMVWPGSIHQLNTIEADQTGQVTLDSGKFTLPPGNYEARIEAPYFGVGYHMARLWNVTSSELTLLGSSSESGGSYGTTNSIISGRFEIQETSEFEVQHWTRDVTGQRSTFSQPPPI